MTSASVSDSAGVKGHHCSAKAVLYKCLCGRPAGDSSVFSAVIISKENKTVDISIFKDKDQQCVCVCARV